MSHRDPRVSLEKGASPTPPAYLRTVVVGTPNLDWFLTSGQRDADEFDAVLRRNGSGLFNGERVLEWGCGCGRLARWIAPRVADFTGIDINPRLVRWCIANLPGRYRKIPFLPPAPLGDHRFDVVYGCSVLTHLRERSAKAWLAELARTTRPGGRVLLTFHDPQHPGAEPVRETLTQTGYAVRFDRLAGSNHLAAYATPEHLAHMAEPAFEFLDYVPSTRSTSLQAILVLGKR